MPLPQYVNPAEYLLELTSSDFNHGDKEDANARIEKLHTDWQKSPEALAIAGTRSVPVSEKDILVTHSKSRPMFLVIVLALLHRSFIKSYRDVVAYGIRFAMYIGLAIMMGTGEPSSSKLVNLRLHTPDKP